MGQAGGPQQMFYVFFSFFGGQDNLATVLEGAEVPMQACISSPAFEVHKTISHVNCNVTIPSIYIKNLVHP